jgi:hypothetical protein
MKNQSWLLIMALMLACNAQAHGLCKQTDKELVCLMVNFDRLYRQNSSRFWGILHRASENAEKCTVPNDTAAFLKLVLVKTGNAEFWEFYNEVAERLCMERTDCFLEGMSKLNRATRSAVVHQLRNPLYYEEAEIQSCLSRVTIP